MSNFTQEQLQAAKAAKSADELLGMAKNAGVELTREQAEKFLHPPVGELSAEELENVAGGACALEISAFFAWEEKAHAEGYMDYSDYPCPSCHAVAGGMYSLFYKHVDYDNGHNKTFEKCFNCGVIHIGISGK